MSSEDSIVSCCSSAGNGIVSNVSNVGNVSFVSSVSSVNNVIIFQINKIIKK